MSVFFASLILIIPLVLQENLLFVTAYFFIFLCLVSVRKKKVKILPSIFMICSITLFSLLLPFGKILFTVGKFSVTAGALALGLKKSFVLCGMVFLSQFATSFVVKIPGKVGNLLSRIFFYFNRFSNVEIKKGQVLQKIDNALCDVYFEDDNYENSGAETDLNHTIKSVSKKTERIWLFAIILVNLFCFCLLFL